MPEHVIVWDLETVPDLDAVARAHHLPEPAVEVAREVFNALARFQAARLSAALLDQVRHEREAGKLEVLDIDDTFCADRRPAACILGTHMHDAPEASPRATALCRAG